MLAELLRSLNEFVGPAILVLLGGIFSVWQLQLKMKRDAAEEAARTRAREQEAKREQDKRDAEVKARLETALEEERKTRQKEMMEQIHHLRTKMQVYENQLKIYEKENLISEKERALLADTVDQITEKLRNRDQENEELRGKVNELKRKVEELEQTAASLRKRLSKYESDHPSDPS